MNFPILPFLFFPRPSFNSPKFLVGTVSTDILIKADDACRDLVDEAKNYLLLPQERPLMQGKNGSMLIFEEHKISTVAFLRASFLSFLQVLERDLGSPCVAARYCSRWAGGAAAMPSRRWSATTRSPTSGAWWRPCRNDVAVSESPFSMISFSPSVSSEVGPVCEGGTQLIWESIIEFCFFANFYLQSYR